MLLTTPLQAHEECENRGSPAGPPTPATATATATRPAACPSAGESAPAGGAAPAAWHTAAAGIHSSAEPQPHPGLLIGSTATLTCC